jgi:hypothetical protein
MSSYFSSSWCPLLHICCHYFRVFFNFLMNLLSYYLTYLWTWYTLTETETSIVPNKDVNTHVNIVIEPVTLILKELSKSCIWVAKYHCWVILFGFLTNFRAFIIVLIRDISFIFFHLFSYNLSTRDPITMQSSLI